jgi:hypothetical protein
MFYLSATKFVAKYLHFLIIKYEKYEKIFCNSTLSYYAEQLRSF